MEPTSDHMTADEHLLEVQDLWDRIAAEAEQSPSAPTQTAEIDRRIADEEPQHPEPATAWEIAREEMRRRSWDCP